MKTSPQGSMPEVIYADNPRDWQDLQNKVCEIFRVCGFDASTDQRLEIARGHVDVDVFARDVSQSPSLTYIAECKLWNKAVPQTVVHAFRTVVTDSGAHVGFLISSSGFQSGGHEAAKNSNIKLVTWPEFQSLFVERWKEGWYESLKRLLTDLFEFYDYFSAPIGSAISGNAERGREFESILERSPPNLCSTPGTR